MLSQELHLPQGYAGLVARLDAPKLAASTSRPQPVVTRKRALPKGSVLQSSNDHAAKKRRMSPRKAAQQAKARPTFSMDSDEEGEDVKQEEQPDQLSTVPPSGSGQDAAAVLELVDAAAEEENEHDAPQPESGPSIEPAVKLQPTGAFSQLTLWSADTPLDEGQDALVRSLREWTRMAALVSDDAPDNCFPLIFKADCSCFAQIHS